MYSARAVANEFLELARREGLYLDPMKLQKLVYFAHGWHLAVTGKPLLKETIEAWAYGPVVPSLYRALKRFGGGPIEGLLVLVDRRTNDQEIPRLPEADEQAKAVVERVWSVHKGLSGIHLANMTHLPGTPWAQLKDASGGEIPRSAQITNESIRQHFLLQASKN